MLSLADLSQAIAAYRSGSVSLGQFEDGFRTASRSMFGESKEVLNACLAIEAAFSELHYGEMSELDFRQELANVVARPFVKEARSAEIILRFAIETPQKTSSATKPLVVSAARA